MQKIIRIGIVAFVVLGTMLALAWAGWVLEALSMVPVLGYVGGGKGYISREIYLIEEDLALVDFALREADRNDEDMTALLEERERIIMALQDAVLARRSLG